MMADYFYSLEMLVDRALFCLPYPITDVPSTSDLADEENQ